MYIKIQSSFPFSREVMVIALMHCIWWTQAALKHMNTYVWMDNKSNSSRTFMFIGSSRCRAYAHYSIKLKIIILSNQNTQWRTVISLSYIFKFDIAWFCWKNKRMQWQMTGHNVAVTESVFTGLPILGNLRHCTCSIMKCLAIGTLTIQLPTYLCRYVPSITIT